MGDGNIRCGNCNYWLGESIVPLVVVDHVAESKQATVSPPRDLRVCKSCGRVNVLVSKAALTGRSSAA